MSLKDFMDMQHEGMRSAASNGIMGLHLVSGPIVGFAIGYWLDILFGCGPWLKVIFFIIGILAGFLNIWRDTKVLLNKIENEDRKYDKSHISH